MNKYRIIPVILLVYIIGFCLIVNASTESKTALDSIGSTTHETSIGDLVADALLSSVTDARIALVPAGSFKEVTVDKGNISSDDIIASLQYPDDLVSIIEITGLQLNQALERSVSLYPQKNMGFLQVSGIKFVYQAKAPKGSRITSVMVGEEKLNNNTVYRVATTKPFANGAYGYFTIWGKIKATELDITSAQAVDDFLARKTKVDYSNLNRITQGR